jgi:thiamine kinase-like enzyme
VLLPVTFDVPSLLREYAANIRARGSGLPGGFEEIVRIVGRAAARPAPAGARRPCHNDLLAGNLLLAGGRTMIVDWEYAGMGDPYFDLGNLAVNNDFDERAERELLTAYHGEPPTDERHARLRRMRILSDAREAAWGFMQAQISDIDFDFDSYAREHLERMTRAAGG